MVHALEITHDLLRPDGILINLQPVGKPRSLEIHTAEVITRAGWIGHRLNFALHKAAQEAVAQVVHGGLFVIEHEHTFPFLYHAESFSVLREWLAEKSKNSILDEATVERAQELSGGTGDDSEVIMREEILIGRLRPAPLKK